MVRRRDNPGKGLDAYIAGVQVNIYSFVDRIHNILYKMEGAGGLDAAKRLLPILGYIIREARNRGGTEEAVKQIVEEMLQNVRRVKQEKIIPFIVNLESIVEDRTVKNFIRDIHRAVKGMGVSTLEEILRVIIENKDIRRALVNYDALGALFEKMVYDAFKGGAGQYLTHRNLVITMREIAWAQFEAEGKDPRYIKVYDPCAGSARFLAFWLEKIIKSYPDYQNPNKLHNYAKRHLFATDKFGEMVGIASVNMMIMGNGVSNIFRADATNHFGPIVNLKSTISFLRSFQDTWDDVKRRIRTTRANIAEELERMEEDVHNFANYILENLNKDIIEIDLSSNEFQSFTHLVLILSGIDIALKRLNGLNELSKLTEHYPIVYLMKSIWANRDSSIRKGFDLILTNPPMGREGRGGGREELYVKDPYVLGQYALAQYEWVYSLSKNKLLEIAIKLGIRLRKNVNKEKLADDVAEYLGREWVSPADYANHAYQLVLRDPELSWSYTIHYDRNMVPLLHRDKLPVQVLMLEQFLRIIRLSGKVFTVIDTGVLSNPGDERVRRILFTSNYPPVKAMLKAVIELPHGAFHYTGAGTKTALLFYERVEKIPNDYEFFIALADYIGYDTHSKDAEPIKENDLPLIIVEYLKWIGRKPEYYDKCLEEWKKERTCSWWTQEFEVIK